MRLRSRRTPYLLLAPGMLWLVIFFVVPMVFLLFAKFQIGVSRSDALQGGAAAGPVFLLWVYTSWFVVLIGAEIAVAHEVEKILIHGARHSFTAPPRSRDLSPPRQPWPAA